VSDPLPAWRAGRPGANGGQATQAAAALFWRPVAALLVLGLFVVAMAGTSLLRSRAQYESHAVTEVQNLSQLLERHLSEIVDRIDHALLDCEDEAERQLARDALAGPAINAYIERQFARQPDLDSLRIADSHGDVRWGIGVDPRMPINSADRDFFIAARQDATAKLLISKPMVGRISGKWTIALARRLNGPHGEFAGVVYAVVALEHLQRLFASLNLGPHGVVSLRDAELAVIARYPEPAGAGSAVGNKTVSAGFLAALQENPGVGVFSYPTGIDRVARTVSYRRVAKYPGYIIVGLANDDYLGAWRKEVAQISFLVALLAVTFVAGAYFTHSAWRRQVNAVAALEREEKKFRRLLESAPDAMVMVDADGKIAMVNRHFETMFDYTVAELVGKSIELLLPAQHRAQHVLFRQSYVGRRDGAPAPMQSREVSAVAKSGRQIPVSITLSAIDTDQGQMVTAAIRDMTERRRSEMATRASETRFRAIFERANAGIALADGEGRLLQVNEAFARSLGYAADELVGMNVARISHPEDLAWEAALVEAVLAGRRDAYRLEKRFLAKSGEVVWMDLASTPIRNDDDGAATLLGLAVDITERKQTEERLTLLIRP
jgi:PAS domain S-box-containing protein